MARSYHIVIGINRATLATEMLFGDYDKDVATDERDDIKEGHQGEDYKGLRVVTLPCDDQATIDMYIKKANA